MAAPQARRALGMALLALLLGGCDTLGYYHQAVVGQLSLLSQRQSIDKVLQQPGLTESTRHQLQVVQQVRRFAHETLALPADKHYDTYVDLQREFVVWNVFAAPEFSMTPQQWCYPVAGCVSYRGYFNETQALGFAATQQAQGLETYVGGVTAYSTLGWFDDPVLSSMLRRDDAQLAGTLFHELAHQLLYVKGDTAFNESFATLVEQEGQRRWLQATYDAADRQTALTSVVTARERQQQFVALVQGTAEELRRLYAGTLPPEQLRERKQAIRESLRERYRTLKAGWQGYAGYDRWFSGPLNNAQLGTVTTYNQWVEAFAALLRAQDGDLPRFYAAATALGKLPQAQRLQRLQELSGQN